MITVNPKEVSIPILHRYLQRAIAPRPIAKALLRDWEGVKKRYLRGDNNALNRPSKKVTLNIVVSTGIEPVSRV